MTRRPTFQSFLVIFLILLCHYSVAMAQEQSPSPEPAAAEPSAAAPSGAPAYQTSGLPVPRFVSLRSEKVFVRSGPALRYPIKWIYQKETLPVEVIQEFDTWRKIRDFDGDEGWVHQSLLAGKRTVLIKAEAPIDLYKASGRTDRLVARLEPDVIALLLRCEKAFCEVEAGGFRGWAERKYLWGIYEDEELD
jgi:SH3-like domain-containing protein